MGTGTQVEEGLRVGGGKHPRALRSRTWSEAHLQDQRGRRQHGGAPLVSTHWRRTCGDLRCVDSILLNPKPCIDVKDEACRASSAASAAASAASTPASPTPSTAATTAAAASARPATTTTRQWRRAPPFWRGVHTRSRSWPWSWSARCNGQGGQGARWQGARGVGASRRSTRCGIVGRKSWKR